MVLDANDKQGKWIQTRIKVGYLLTETGQNGLVVLPNSHKDESIKWNKFDRDGEPKPKLYSIINNKDLKLLNSIERTWSFSMIGFYMEGL